jgi:hypothetical protein
VIGRQRELDMATGARGRPGYDAQDKFGAGTLYEGEVAQPWTLTPRASRPFWSTSKVSNKPAEHNIGNMPVRIVVAQLPAQTRPRNLNHLVSRRLVLRPGNQSLGGT